MKYFLFIFFYLIYALKLEAQKAKLYKIQIKPDGSFSPRYLTINHLDTVEWVLSDRSQSIAAINLADTTKLNCLAYKPYNESKDNDFTGPKSSAVPGIFALSPDGKGFVIANKSDANPLCGLQTAKAKAGNQYLCEEGQAYASMDWTWKNPNIAGVFIRLRWDEVNSAPGIFNWSILDREISKAVANGKMYSLGFKAGATGTPAWIFNPVVAGDLTVKKLKFRDGEEETDCGSLIELGSPTDTNYQKLYFDLIKAAASHIKEKSAWYRALAYIKPSGANLYTHENRLPNNCVEGCSICNPEVWAKEGNYTPAGIYDYYKKQFDLMAQLFPDKFMGYALIQAGFPIVNNKGETKAPLTTPLPGGTEQTEAIMAIGRNQHGIRFVVSHNGLQVRPQDAIPAKPACPNEGKHPAVKPYGNAGSSCPNRWALDEGSFGQITGWQTQNAKEINKPKDMESCLRNAWDNSDGIYIEFYEERIWEAENAGPILDPAATNQTLKDWNERLYQRQRAFWGSKVADPFPLSHKYIFKRTTTNKNEAQSFYFVNPINCIQGTKSFGGIIISPESSTPTKNILSNNISMTLSPNPFDKKFTIQYSLEIKSIISIEIYDLAGRKIQILEQGPKMPGNYQIPFASDHINHSILPGSYILRYKVNEQVLTKRLIKI